MQATRPPVPPHGIATICAQIPRHALNLTTGPHLTQNVQSVRPRRVSHSLERHTVYCLSVGCARMPAPATASAELHSFVM